jgi:AraC family transcriptional regulator
MPACLRLGRHAHPTGQLVFVLEGGYWESWGRRRIGLQPGSVIFRPPGEPHANAFGAAGALTLLVSYRPERLAGLAGCRRPAELPALFADLRHQVELELRREDPASALALEGLALLLAARVGRFTASPRRPEWLGEALRFIEARHAEPIGLAAVAGAVERHRATVAAGFRRYLGRSVGQTIRAAQVRHALDRIRATKQPFAEIAAECGFFDQAHMGRLVKRATGNTPGEIRKEG